MTEIQFKSVKEFVCSLIDNEGQVLCDNFGRQWKYFNYTFFFKDIGLNDKFEEGLQCVHLFETRLAYKP